MIGSSDLMSRSRAAIRSLAVNKSRRSFLGLASVLPLVPLVQASAACAAEPAEKPLSPGARQTYPIALSSYSLWRFRNEEFRDFDKCLDIADQMGFDGVELLLYQLQQN